VSREFELPEILEIVENRAVDGKVGEREWFGEVAVPAKVAEALEAA
jgi:hypothetical protein